MEWTFKWFLDERLIYYQYYSVYNQLDDTCSVEAYQWNPKIQIFEYNDSLSIKFQEKFCSELCADLGQIRI